MCMLRKIWNAKTIPRRLSDNNGNKGGERAEFKELFENKG